MSVSVSANGENFNLSKADLQKGKVFRDLLKGTQSALYRGPKLVIECDGSTFGSLAEYLRRGVVVAGCDRNALYAACVKFRVEPPPGMTTEKLAFKAAQQTQSDIAKFVANVQPGLEELADQGTVTWRINLLSEGVPSRSDYVDHTALTSYQKFPDIWEAALREELALYSVEKSIDGGIVFVFNWREATEYCLTAGPQRKMPVDLPMQPPLQQAKKL